VANCWPLQQLMQERSLHGMPGKYVQHHAILMQQV
jgi:hypothetical protein